MAWGKHLGRCGRSLSGEETLGAGPDPDPRALLAVPLGDAWLYEARRRGASPDCTHSSRDPLDQRGKPNCVGSVLSRGSRYLSNHGAWFWGFQEKDYSVHGWRDAETFPRAWLAIESGATGVSKPVCVGGAHLGSSLPSSPRFPA